MKMKLSGIEVEPVETVSHINDNYSADKTLYSTPLPFKTTTKINLTENKMGEKKKKKRKIDITYKG